MNEGITDVVVGVLTGFNRLSKSIQESDDTSLRASLTPKIDDELARFKVWAGNSGAHRTGRASLEHRLRDASHVRQQVLRLLSGLEDSLEDAADIMTGKATPWEEIEDGEEPLDDLEAETEMEQIALDVTELVDCLLRLSVSIQNPAPHDRFMSSTFTDTSAYEAFDIQHVRSKFQDIDEGLAQRLGKAMSRRRQYFKYREAHHQKLSHGLDRHGDTNKTESTLPAPSTLASSIPLQMKQEVPIDISGDDTQSDGRASVTSFATSVSAPKTLKVPPMPDDALKGPFMCPFCYLIISVQDTRAWKKHVFGDLRPYNCLAVHCTAPDREFSRRNEWMQHMLQSHLRVYRCPCGCPDNFSSAAESKGHLLRSHSGAIPESKVDSIVELSSQPLAQDSLAECPFCPEKLKSLKQYRRHVGNHQQDLALFVLPKTKDGDDNSEESHSLSGHESDDISLSAHDEELIVATVHNQDSTIDAEDRPTEDVQQIRLRNNLDRDPLNSRSFSVSPTRSYSTSSREKALNDRVPENSDGKLPTLRGFTPSPPRSVSSWYDEPVSAEFSEDEVSPINPEQPSHNAVPSTQRHQPFDGDQVNQSPQRSSRGTSDDLVEVEIGSRGELLGDPATAHVIDDGAGNKRRASSPPDDTGSNLKEGLLPQRPLERKLSTAPCRNCTFKKIACREGEPDSKCWNFNREGLECITDGITDTVTLESEPATYPEDQGGSIQIPLAEASLEATEADNNKRTKAKVLYDFTGDAPNELTVGSNELVDILHQGDKGWSLAMSEKQPGPAWIPTTYVEEQTTAIHEQSSEDSNYAEESSKAQEKSPRARDYTRFTKDQFMELLKKSFEGEEREMYLKNHPEMPPAQFDEAAARILSKLDLGSKADNWSTHAAFLEKELERFSENVSRQDRDPLPIYEPQQRLVEVRASNSGYKATLQEAQLDQWSAHGGSAEPLTAEALKSPRRYQDSSSSDSGRDESDYQQSTTTRTTRYSAIESEDVTIKVTGHAVLKIGGVEIQCQDGGEINISQPDRNDGSDRVSAAANEVEGTESKATVSTAPSSTVWNELDDLKSRIHRLELAGKLPKTSGAAMSRASDERPPTASNTVYSDNDSTHGGSRPLPIRASRKRPRPVSYYGPMSRRGQSFSDIEIGQSQGPRPQQEQDKKVSMNTESDPVDYPTHHSRATTEENHEFTDADLDYIDEWAKEGLPEGITLGQAFSQSIERMLSTVPPKLELPPTDKDTEVSGHTESSATGYPDVVPASERTKFGDYTR